MARGNQAVNRSAAAWVMALALALRAEWNPPSLGAFSVATLTDPAVVARLQTRFHASGAPLFLLGNPSSGLQQGDILRFGDKAFLVDGAVWQTLATEGALRNLKQSPLVRLQAGATPGAWTERARLVGSTKERKLYEFGASLLRSMEQSMGGVPDGQRLFLSTEGGKLVITAPAGFLDKIRAVAIERERPKDQQVPAGRPRWVGSTPSDTQWVGEPLRWQGWAVDDSGGSSLGFRYGLTGALPEGIRWNPEDRTLTGVPTVPGTTRAKIWVGSNQGGDTLTWSPSVMRRIPPVVEGEPGGPTCSQAWSFRPWIHSQQWPQGALRTKLEQAPKGMTWDSTTQSMVWDDPSSWCGRTAEVALSVSDPAGKKTVRQWSLPVVAREQYLATEGLRVDLPKDTLLQGRWYAWEPGVLLEEWKRQGIRLDSITGNLQTIWSGKRLDFRSLQLGTARLTFWFREGNLPRQLQVLRGVRPYAPPRFIGEVGGSSVPAGTVRAYHPLVEDPQGGPVRLEVEIPPGAPIRWVDSELVVSPRFPGSWAVQIVATDTLGQASRRWIGFRSEGRAPQGLRLQSTWANGVNPWFASWDFGRSRVGLFTPQPVRLVHNRGPGTDLPFFTVGADLLSETSRAQGSRLGTDLGLGLRLPDRKILTGGLMARIEGRTAPQGTPLPVQIECELLGWIRQGILLTDTSGMATLVDSLETFDKLEEMRGHYGPLIYGVLQDAFDQQNMVLLTRLEAWVRGPANLWGGLGVMRDDRPIPGYFRQRLHLGLRWRPQVRDWGGLETAIRLGWGPDEAGWGVRADFQWASGILP